MEFSQKMVKQLLLVGFGGFAGSIARFLVSRLNLTWNFHSIPMGTLTVNILGSLIIGFISGLIIHSSTSTENLKLLLITGFCGGFTTFSAFTFENLQLIQEGYHGTALIYIGTSLILGILAVLGGLWLSKIFI